MNISLLLTVDSFLCYFWAVRVATLRGDNELLTKVDQYALYKLLKLGQ